MSRIAYVNGRYVAHRDATVSIDDRGYQFADGVYEVVAVQRGTLIDEDAHFARLTRSLHEMRIGWPVEPHVLATVIRRVIRLNHVVNGSVYLQITRGVARRAHDFPIAARPQLVVTARTLKPVPASKLTHGISVITVPDQRWARRDIKSISLLPNILAKQLARDQGADEAWQIAADGTVTEGAASNAWIVTVSGDIRTRAADDAILNGVTRLAILAVARQLDINVVESPFTPADITTATEAFISSTTQLVIPVTTVDRVPVGDGKPGRVTRAILAVLHENMLTRGTKS